MAIYEILEDRIEPVADTTFEKAGLRERWDLQRLLRARIDVVEAETLVLTEEFADWEDSRRRIDLLGLDKDANLVVFELKRTDDGGHMELQAIRYAAMVEAMTFEKAVEVHGEYLSRNGDKGDAKQRILEFLDWQEPDEDEFAQDVRIVLVAADFGRELTTSVLWLNEYGLDIRCVRIKPYDDHGRLLLDVQQVIPLPEAKEYQVRISAKAERERTSRREQSELGGIMRRFWTQLLNEARERTPLHNAISPSQETWISATSGVPGLQLNYAFGRQTARVELYCNTGDQAKNKGLFDQLFASRAAIEKRFGGPLGWERMDGKQACRIRADLPVATTVRVEASWPELTDRMISAMIQLERALRPELDRLSR
jgi:hypothetical protein